MPQFWIFNIPYGEENAIHQKDLAERLGMTSSHLKEEIRDARLRGVEICSSAAGYFFPKDEVERKKYVNIQLKQALTRFKTSKAIRRSLREIEGQTHIIEDNEENTKEDNQ